MEMEAKMKKILIISISDNNNYGNRLQNYAMQKVLKNKNFIVTTLWNQTYKDTMFVRFKKIIKFILKKTIFKNDSRGERYNCFSNFTNQYINNTDIVKPGFSLTKLNKQYDYYVIGSDQIWNYNFRNKYFGILEFGRFDNSSKCISYSASIGINDIPKEMEKIYKDGFNHIKAISVREDRAKEIVEELTNRTDVQVLVDPTMLLKPEEWDKVSKKPEQLCFEKYILNYFLGELSESRKKEIERFAQENDCHIINILDPKDPFYVCGPSEFLYLEKHAFLICTDSFHSSIFAILYNRPFLIFDREDKLLKMNSRIDTLLHKFNLENRRFNGRIAQENISHDYTNAYKILEEERKKSFTFLDKALND